MKALASVSALLEVSQTPYQITYKRYQVLMVVQHQYNNVYLIPTCSGRGARSRAKDCSEDKPTDAVEIDQTVK